MKRTILFLLVAILFVGCGYEFKKKGEVPTETTVLITDVGYFKVVGEVEYGSYDLVYFVDQEGRKITTHLSKCVIVEAEIKPAPVSTPVKTSPPVKNPEVQSRFDN
jgi:hypothetical protein